MLAGGGDLRHVCTTTAPMSGAGRPRRQGHPRRGRRVGRCLPVRPATARFGARQVWIASLATFMLGSVLVGLARSASALIVFRVIQGLGAGMLLPVGQAALAQAAGSARLGRVMSLFGLPMLLIPTLGPVIGGAIAEHASWRWIFYINVPVSLAAVLAAVRFLPAARPQAAPGWTCAGSSCSPPASPPSTVRHVRAGQPGDR